jgi:hypothetical protein
MCLIEMNHTMPGMIHIEEAVRTQYGFR